jgi:hypothetical protein
VIYGCIFVDSDLRAFLLNLIYGCIFVTVASHCPLAAAAAAALAFHTACQQQPQQQQQQQQHFCYTCAVPDSPTVTLEFTIPQAFLYCPWAYGIVSGSLSCLLTHANNCQ